MNAAMAMRRVKLPARRSSSNLAAMCLGDDGLSPDTKSMSKVVGCFRYSASSFLSIRAKLPNAQVCDGGLQGQSRKPRSNRRSQDLMVR